MDRIPTFATSRPRSWMCFTSVCRVLICSSQSLSRAMTARCARWSP